MTALSSALPSPLEIFDVPVIRRDDVLGPGAASWPAPPTLLLDFPADLPYTSLLNIPRDKGDAP